MKINKRAMLEIGIPAILAILIMVVAPSALAEVPPGPPGETTIEFHAGWNMVSLPASNLPIGILMMSAPGYAQAWYWNSATGQYDSVGGQLPDIHKGYWIWLSGNYNLTVPEPCGG